EEDGIITVGTNTVQYEADYLINCAGLYSDKLAKMSGVDTDVKIIPFRGEYFKLDESVEHYVKTLIYPVPNPVLPFLGVHFTNMIGGGVDVGPNAVLGFRKEAYRKLGFHFEETKAILTFPGLYRMGLKNIKEAAGEYYRSFNKKAFVKEAKKLVPLLKEEDIEPMEAGVRAQAMKPDGSMLGDFHFEENKAILTFPGLYRMGLKNIKEAAGEYYRSFNKKAFVKEAKKLVPLLKEEDIEPMEAGVRAQAMKPDGSMLGDFHFEENE